MIDLVEVLRAEGLQVEDHRRAPAPGPYHPLGQVLHHTASRPGRAAPSLALVHDGGAGTAPGPLCSVLWGRDLIARVITDGKANHAGRGSRDVLARLRANLPPVGDARYVAPVSDTDGNAWLIGHEIENDGVGEPWPDELVAVVCRGVAAVARAHGWSERTTILHREWTARKIDPNHEDGPWWRARVAAALLPAVHMPISHVHQEDDMLIVRNVESEAIHTLAERTGLGPNVGSLAVVDELIASGIVAARPDGAKWIDLSDAAFRALPVA